MESLYATIWNGQKSPRQGKARYLRLRTGHQPDAIHVTPMGILLISKKRIPGLRDFTYQDSNLSKIIQHCNINIYL